MPVTRDRTARRTPTRVVAIDDRNLPRDTRRAPVATTRSPTQATRDDQPPSGRPSTTRRSDAEARASARRYLDELIGPPEAADVSWDDTHRLQGHLHIGTSELIVIAGRDRDHTAVVLTMDDWDHVRHNGGTCVRTLVTELAIGTAQRIADLIDRTRHADIDSTERASPLRPPEHVPAPRGRAARSAQ